MTKCKKLNLTNIAKEFNELVELQNSIFLPLNERNSILTSFGFFPKRVLEKTKKFSSLSQDQYSAIINAADALKQYGRGEIGQEIYHKNLLKYYLSKRTDDLISDLFK
jgi:hypothetical protein